MHLRLWKRAQIPDHYAVTDIGVFRLQTNHALMAMEGLGLYTIMQFTRVKTILLHNFKFWYRTLHCIKLNPEASSIPLFGSLFDVIGFFERSTIPYEKPIIPKNYIKSDEPETVVATELVM